LETTPPKARQFGHGTLALKFGFRNPNLFNGYISEIIAGSVFNPKSNPKNLNGEKGNMGLTFQRRCAEIKDLDG